MMIRFSSANIVGLRNVGKFLESYRKESVHISILITKFSVLSFLSSDCFYFYNRLLILNPNFTPSILSFLFLSDVIFSRKLGKARGHRESRSAGQDENKKIPSDPPSPRDLRNEGDVMLCCTVLYCTVLYCTVLYCTVLYCTVLYCTVLYCTVLCINFLF